MSYENSRIQKKIQDYLEYEDVNELVAFDLNVLSKSIKKTEKSLNNKDFELIFIGTSGSGKTTIISSILGMYYDEKGKLVQVMPSDEGGRTTPCTIEIIPTENTEIEIFPKPKCEVESILNEYCYFITEQKGNVPAEIRTIIKKWTNKLDKKELIKIKDIQVIKEKISREIGIENLHTQSLKIKCSKNEKNEVFKEINKILDNIRKGKLDTFVIPDKIKIYVNKKYINIPSHISKIVDTRGISSETVKSNNTIIARKDLEEYINQENSIVIYVNEFASIEQPVVNFYLDKFKSYRTQPEDLIKFIVLIHAKDGSIESKVDDDNEREEFIDEKILEFTNSIVLEEYEFDSKDIKEYYEYINEVIKNAKGKISNFIVYEPIRGLKKETEKGKNYFIEQDIEKIKETREQFNDEINKTISTINNILIKKLETDTQKAKGYILNKIGLSSETVIGRALNDYINNIESKTKEHTKNWVRSYLKQLLNLTRTMDGRTIAAYIRGNGMVISRLEKISDDIFDWHKTKIKSLDEKLEIELNNLIKSFQKEMKRFEDDLDMNLIDVLKNTTRQNIYQFVNDISDSLIKGLDELLVGKKLFWNQVRNNYEKNSKSKYAEALYEVMENSGILRQIMDVIEKEIKGKNILKMDKKLT